MKAYFERQAALHPAMTPQDALKMAYQAAFGAEHLAGDEAAVRRYLHDELTACQAAAEEPLTEAISPDLCRVNLRAWKAAKLPEEWLARMFLDACQPRPDGESRFRKILTALDDLAGNGGLPFDFEAWRQAREAYLASGLHAVHHSDAYRERENPAYRLILSRYGRMLPLLAALDLSERQIIALDGRCASGKTTLAADLARITGAAVVHMDDFFLPPALRTPERLAQPGGNVHYERFIADVLPGLLGGQAFSYPVFDCSVMALNGARSVPAASLVIVEGAYSCHPALGEYMTLRAFSDVDPDTQRRRILARNGEAGLQNFVERWIPLEERYFEACRVRERAQVVLV